MYEYEKYRGIQFRMTNKDEVHTEIINHFEVRGMSLKRSENPTLIGWKMVQRSKSCIEYVEKTEEDDFQDEKTLNILEDFKKEY